MLAGRGIVGDTTAIGSLDSSKVEHVFQVLKLKFGFVKVRYRGLKKNGNRLFAACALVNLFLVRKRLLRLATA